MEPLKLNLGSGPRGLPGYRSVDLYDLEADQRVDLRVLPWPWADSSVDAVAMLHILEHFPNPEEVAMEVWRILKPGGEWQVEVPHAHGAVSPSFYHVRSFAHSAFHSILCGQKPYRFEGRRLFRETYYHVTLPFRWLRPLEGLASRHADGWEMTGLFPPLSMEWRGVALK